MAGTKNDQYDPVANIVASANYAAHRYGTIDLGPLRVLRRPHEPPEFRGTTAHPAHDEDAGRGTQAPPTAGGRGGLTTSPPRPPAFPVSAALPASPATPAPTERPAVRRSATSPTTARPDLLGERLRCLRAAAGRARRRSPPLRAGSGRLTAPPGP
ncbi:hypothetical protein GCM10020227_27620 [Streptomyces flavovirens]